ncbi:hypothetical protein [Modestobacter sp. Leaf380]|uniref:hypothetical protein n=1 Tax=Modestobacter sp. Leaf380 TaxID=1736356 RepID=UPI0006F54F98|nr:hypothetical protein [Modestobacter sp. Leaf380]KQS64351.1 hypothetical protein ASG41_17120 [Modestobacter sp. Leaf380]
MTQTGRPLPGPPRPVPGSPSPTARPGPAPAAVSEGDGPDPAAAPSGSPADPVDTLAERLQAVPVAGHAAVLEAEHERLQRRLATIDQL